MKKYISILFAVLFAVIAASCSAPSDTASAGSVRSYSATDSSQEPSNTASDKADIRISDAAAYGSGYSPDSDDTAAGSSERIETDEPDASAGSASESSSAYVSSSPDAAEEAELLADPSLTVAGIKSMNYSMLKARASFLVGQFFNSDIPRNSYNNFSFRHDKSFLSYDDPEYEYMLGIDVSEHQGEIDWEAVKAQGISFAMIRAGYRGYGENGTLNEDSYFRQNIEKAKEAGILTGAYFFSQAVTKEEALEEAEFVLSILDGISLDLPLVFDEEIIRDDDARTDNMLLSQFTENALAFFSKTEAAGYTSMLYTNLIFEYLIYDLERFSGIPIWFAGYDVVPMTPYHFDMWQYSESGSIDGIDAPVDMNIWIKKAGE